MTDKELFEMLSYDRKNVYDEITEDEQREMNTICEDYKNFLSAAKTERECVKEAVKLAEKNGFVPISSKSELNAGDKIYMINRNKNIFLAVIGSDSMEDGINIVGAHIDSPRLDLKQNPLYEKTDMAFLKTHYYGGLKKYQWTALPLAIHGVVMTKDGAKEICIGEHDDDPVFCITDLLPHLAKDQMSKKMTEGIEAENMNLLIAGMPIKADDVKERVKFAVLKLLNEKYGMVERDFQTAEIEIVPAGRARDVGLDRSLVGSYGQDDRVCAYTTLRAIFEIESPKKTAVAFLADKEEIGSMGNTGSQSAFMEMCIAEMMEKVSGSCSITGYNRAIRNSACMSSDVSAAVDPNYENVHEMMNATFAGKGVAIMKYTGARGKYDSSDAGAEFVNEIARIMDDNEIIWQTGELGKIDQGGGGTIAQYVANLNMDVIDCGVPVLSMHSPFEVTAKSDIYMAYKAYMAFYRNR